MQVDYLIAGQGLCGTWLSYFLMEAGASVMVADPGLRGAASMASAGVINPITGRRLARQWLAESVAPVVQDAYAGMSIRLGTPLLREVAIHTWFDSVDEALLFEQKAATTHGDVLYFDSRIEAAAAFENPFGAGTISPAYTADLRRLLPGWREQLRGRNALLEERLDWSGLTVTDTHCEWKGIRARAVIDCSGAAAASNPLFWKLPFALNKGEVLFVRIPGLPSGGVYKHAHLSIAPWDGDVFWVGSSFDWREPDGRPTEAFRRNAEGILQRWLRLPYEVTDHKAAVRPATVTRKPFAGLHPQQPRLGILDGTGAKGCSLAPFLAKSLADHLVSGTPLIPEADVARYAKTLAR